MTTTPKEAGRLASMHPAYFALVMATGIVSIGARLVSASGSGVLPSFIVDVAGGMPFLGLNAIFYVALWVLTIVRVARHREQVRADLFSHGRCVGFFTMVAATCVLGSQALVIANAPSLALGLWFFAIALWVLLTYAIVTILTVKEGKPTLAEGINGGWLVMVVASHSVAVLGAQLAGQPSFGSSAPIALFFSLAMWLGASMQYIWIIALIFYRYTFFTLSPNDLAPPYWINMGAAAIATLAGTMLVGASDRSPVLLQILPFVRGFTLFWWATATWWIPMLLLLGIWRHAIKKFPLRYDPLYWGAVFPLGMYTVCTVRLSQAVEAPFLIAIPRVFIFIALTAWLAVILGMMRSARKT